MGMHNEVLNAPDLYGLPEYKISEVMTEIVGTDIRVVCGVRKFGEVHWLYSVLINAADYLRMNHQVREAAMEAFNISQMMDRRKGH